ncbi:DBH-like monooxygenase protein 1 [Mactra antiquata]
MLSIILVLFCLSSSAWCVEIAGVKTTESFEQSTVLDNDDNFILFWNFNDTHVTFEVHVHTKGWVGFGLSSNGNMFPADVDRHTVGHSTPVVDKSQDWHLLLAKENEFGTVLKFVRKIRTCDDSEDENIQLGTSRVIYAYGQQDPVSEDSINYHGTSRGTKSVALLSMNAELDQLPADSRHYDFLNKNYVVPNDTTTYWCVGYKLPQLVQHHMIKYEALVTPGNELHVHHIIVYRCEVNNPEMYHGKAGLCYGKQRPIPQCGNIIIAWAIGAEPFYFPPEVGFTVGGAEDDGSLYIMETHFDNPHRKNDMLDDSGIRITITPTLRPHEAGMLTIGHSVGPYQVIPPGLENYVTKGYCSAECLNEGFRQNNLTEVKLIGLVQHSHLLGESLNTRHFRNGTEIKPIMLDPYYDFNFQAIRNLPREVPLRMGDSLELDCFYNSKDRTKATFGGLSIEEEMCLSFIYYYPKMTLSNCMSQPTYDNFHVGLQDLYYAMTTADWTNKTGVDNFINKLGQSSLIQACTGEHFQEKTTPIIFQPPQNLHPYIAPPVDCS